MNYRHVNVSLLTATAAAAATVRLLQLYVAFGTRPALRACVNAIIVRMLAAM